MTIETWKGGKLSWSMFATLTPAARGGSARPPMHVTFTTANFDLTTHLSILVWPRRDERRASVRKKEGRIPEICSTVYVHSHTISANTAVTLFTLPEGS